MSELFSWLPAGGCQRLAADALWQSTTLAAAGLIAAWFARRRPALRGAILLAAAALALAVPPLSTVARLGGGGWLTPESPFQDASQVVRPLPTAGASSISAPAVAAPVARGTHAPVAANLASSWASHLWRWFVGCWLAASAYLALRLLRGIFVVRRWVRNARPCRDPEIEAALSRAALTIGVRRPEILWSSAVDSPALVALGPARLLLPAEMPRDIDWFAVFCHELAHRARRDDLGRLVIELSLIALPWQLLLWLVGRQFRTACEDACDDWAVASGADPVELASLLVELVPERRPAFALGMAESPSATRHRILRLLASDRINHPRLGRVASVLCLTLAIITAAVLALMQFRTPRSADPLQPQPSPLAAHSPVPPGVGARRTAAPSEEDKSTLPTYIIAAPDILLIDVLRVVPKSPYRVQTGDTLNVEVASSIKGQFVVGIDGEISLGADYGSCDVGGLSLAEARDFLKKHLASRGIESPFALTVNFDAMRRPIDGEHLVGPDGTINLGVYGTVSVSGMTIAQAKVAIELQLSSYLEQPRVSVDVFAYNSQVYYVITEGAGVGDTVTRVPITGNETVLDALAQIKGLGRLWDANIWIARPTPGDDNSDRILKCNWAEVVKGAATTTNYQVMPGDRIFVASKFGTVGWLVSSVTRICESISDAAASEQDSAEEPTEQLETY